MRKICKLEREQVQVSIEEILIHNELRDEARPKNSNFVTKLQSNDSKTAIYMLNTDSKF